MTDVVERIQLVFKDKLTEYSTGPGEWKEDWLEWVSYDMAKAALAALEPGDEWGHVIVRGKDEDLWLRGQAAEEMRERAAQAANQVWEKRDGGCWISAEEFIGNVVVAVRALPLEEDNE